MAKKPFTPLALIGIACCLGVSSCSTTVEVKQDIRNVLASYENPSPDINVALVNEVKKCMSEKSFTYSGSQNIIDGSSVQELAMSGAHFAKDTRPPGRATLAPAMHPRWKTRHIGKHFKATPKPQTAKPLPSR